MILCFKQTVSLSLVDVAFLSFVAVWPLSVSHLIVFHPKCLSCCQRCVRFELEPGFNADVNTAVLQQRCQHASM